MYMRYDYKCYAGYTYADYVEDDDDKDVDNAETMFVVISYRGTMRWS